MRVGDSWVPQFSEPGVPEKKGPVSGTAKKVEDCFDWGSFSEFPDFEPPVNASLFIQNASPEDKATWDKAFKASMGWNPFATEEEFAKELLSTEGVHLKEPLRTFAAAIFLGKEPYRELKKGLGVTVALSLPKEGRKIKMVIYSPEAKEKVLGKGGEAIVRRCLAVSSKIMEGEGRVISKPQVKHAIYRQLLNPPTFSQKTLLTKDQLGQQTLQQTAEVVREIASQSPGKPLPNGVLLHQGWPVGIYKPLTLTDSDKSFGTFMAEGDMDAWINANDPDTRKLLKTFESVVRGLGAIVLCHLDFMDLKPPNILVDKSGKAAISDWSGVDFLPLFPDEMTPEEALQVIKSHEGLERMTLTAASNLVADLDALKSIQSTVERMGATLERALTDGESGEDELENLKEACILQAVLYEKIQVFHLGISLLDLLLGPVAFEKLVKRNDQENGLISRPIDKDQLKSALYGIWDVDSLLADKLFKFFAPIVCEPRESRASFTTVWKNYQALMKSL